MIITFENFTYNQILGKELLKTSSNSSSLQKMRELINNGANVNFNDVNDGTPLMKATVALFYSGIKLLIENGADVNLYDSRGDTAFIKLSRFPKYTLNKYERNIKKIIDLFILNNADMNIRNNNNNNLFDYFDGKFTNYIKTTYPEQYNDYLAKKESEIYNI